MKSIHSEEGGQEGPTHQPFLLFLLTFSCFIPFGRIAFLLFACFFTLIIIIIIFLALLPCHRCSFNPTASRFYLVQFGISNIFSSIGIDLYHLRVDLVSRLCFRILLGNTFPLVT